MSAGAVLTAEDLTRFERDGHVHLRGAFADDAAAAMRDVVWAELERRGIRRDDPATWTDEAPGHLQHLRRDPAFRAVGSDRTLGAIADLLGPERPPPPDWGAFFLLFPTRRPWTVPWRSWHVDHDWLLQVASLHELKVHACFGDVVAGGGAMPIVAGSHHVVAEALRRDPPPNGARAAAIRTRVMRSHPYLVELGTDPGDDEHRRAGRVARFADQEEDVLGHPVRVVELTGRAGDVHLIHPLVLHTRPTNAGTTPRFLLDKDLYA